MLSQTHDYNRFVQFLEFVKSTGLPVIWWFENRRPAVEVQTVNGELIKEWICFYLSFLCGKTVSMIDWTNDYMSKLGSQIVRVVT